MWNGTMFVDLDWPLNASSLLSASAELLVIVYAESISWATLLDCKYITWLRGPLLPFYNGKQNYSFDCFISLCSILILVILLIFKLLLLFGFQFIKVIANQCVSSQVSELCCYVDLAVLAAAVNIIKKRQNANAITTFC